jgi:hypothetical protein
MIIKTVFNQKNLTSNAGILPLLNYTNDEAIFQLLDEMLTFENENTEKIKMNHLKTLIVGGFIGVDKLERFIQIKNDKLLESCGIYVRNPENISRFLKCFDYRTTQELRDLNFKIFIKLLKKSKIKKITIDMDSSVINTEGSQEGACKGYNPNHKGNKCYNDLYAFCYELKATISGYRRPGNANTSNGAVEFIKEIIANISPYVDDITFRMDSGYFSEDIINIIEEKGYKYIIKAKIYDTMTNELYKNLKIEWEKLSDTAEIKNSCIKLNRWKKARRFTIKRVKKSKEDIKQVSMFENMYYEHVFYVSNQIMSPSDIVENYKIRGDSENYIKELKNDLNIDTFLTNSFFANEAFLQTMILVYNIFLMYKFDYCKHEYRQQIKTFRLKYIYVAAKISNSAGYIIVGLSKYYPYKNYFTRNTA